MSTPLTIPRLEMAMTEGVLAEWLARRAGMRFHGE